MILVDDGFATGSTTAAVRACGRRAPAGSWGRAGRRAGYLRAALGHADEVVCLVTPDPFQAVGLWGRASSRRPTRKSGSPVESDPFCAFQVGPTSA